MRAKPWLEELPSWVQPKFPAHRTGNNKCLLSEAKFQYSFLPRNNQLIHNITARFSSTGILPFCNPNTNIYFFSAIECVVEILNFSYLKGKKQCISVVLFGISLIMNEVEYLFWWLGIPLFVTLSKTLLSCPPLPCLLYTPNKEIKIP